MPSQNLLGFVGQSLLELGPWRPLHWWVAGTVLGAFCWVTFSGQHRRPSADRHAAWWAWHWVTGGPLEPRKALVELDDERPRHVRIAHRVLIGAVRTAVPVALVAGEYVRSGAPHGTGVGTTVGAGAIGTAVLVGTTLGILSAAVGTAHYLHWMRPLHRAVHRLCGHDEDKRPSSYLTVRRAFEEGRPCWLVRRVRKLLHLPPLPEGVIVRMSPEFDCRQVRIDQVVATTKAKLDLGDVTATPVLRGRKQSIQFRPAAQMPAEAMFSDSAIRKLVEAAKASAPIIGVTTGDRPVAVDLDSDAPHVLISAGTGGGKSTMIRTIAAQLMWHGAEVLVIDYKRHSHGWLRPLPGVRYARDIEEIHRALIEMGHEGNLRNRALDNVDPTAGDVAPTWPRKVVVCEELNATMSQLKIWWRNHKQPGDPPTSPAITAMGQLLFMGRAVRIHVLAVAQMATAKDLGGPEMRENFAVRILARYTSNAARMLVPECGLPATDRHPGRAQVCIGGVATNTQVVYMTEQQAREWVADRRGMKPKAHPVDVASVASEADPVSQGKPDATVAPDIRDGLTPITLAEASKDEGLGVVELNVVALRTALRRDPERPQPVGKRDGARVYDPQALQRWEANRPRAVAAQASESEPIALPQAADQERNEVDGVDRMEARTEG